MMNSVTACASFPHKWYVLDVKAQELMGPEEKDDLTLEFCNSDDEYKCVVLEIEAFRALRKDYDDKVERLKACEQK